MIRFTIPWQVVAKQGDRAVRVGDFIRHYQPKKVKQNASALILLMAQHAPPKPLEGPLKLTVTCEFPWRVIDSNKRRAGGPAWKDTKPDLDNLNKQVMDCLQFAGFFANDAQVAWLVVRKQFTCHGRTHIEIEELNP